MYTVYRYIYLFGLIYRWFLSTSNIYIYISYLLASNFSLSLYIYIHIYIYGFNFPLNPVRVKWLCLSSQLSGCSFRQRWPCFSLWDAANNGRISDSEDLVDPKYKTVWGQGFRTDTLGVTNGKAHGCVSEMVKFAVRMFYSENIGTWWWISDFKGLCFPASEVDQIINNPLLSPIDGDSLSPIYAWRLGMDRNRNAKPGMSWT